MFHKHFDYVIGGLKSCLSNGLDLKSRTVLTTNIYILSSEKLALAFRLGHYQIYIAIFCSAL